MAAASRRGRGSLGSQRRRRRRPEASTGVPRRITPCPPCGQRLGSRGAPWKSRLVACEARSRRLPRVCRSGRVLALRPMPAQSRRRPNPIVQPGMGLASRWRVPNAARGGPTPQYRRTERPSVHHAPLRPGVRHLEPPDTASAADRVPQLRKDSGRTASPCDCTWYAPPRV